MADAHFRYFDDEERIVLDEAFDRMGRFPHADFLRRVTFPDHPYGSPPLGTPDSVGRFGEKKTRDHYLAHYGPNRAHIVVVGDVDPDRIFYLAERYFRGLKPLSGATRETVRPAGPIVARIYGPRPLVELRYVLPGTADPDLPALQAFVHHLACAGGIARATGEDGGELPWRSLEIDFHEGALASLLSLRAVPVDERDPWPACDALRRAVQKTANDGLTPTQLEAARRRWRAAAIDRFEDPPALADALALAAARGDWKAVLPGRLDGLETETANAAIRKRLGEADPVEVLTEVKK
jgi:zinc protease